jgi:hypothetical protein
MTLTCSFYGCDDETHNAHGNISHLTASYLQMFCRTYIIFIYTYTFYTTLMYICKMPAPRKVVKLHLKVTLEYIKQCL